MQILVKILLGIGVLIAILLIIALFTKKEYTIKRVITINKPKQQVFDYIKYLKNQDNYSVWVRRDPAMKKDFKGTDGTVGFIYAWDGNKQAGKGEQEIKSLSEGEKISNELRFVRPFEGIAFTEMSTTPVADNQTQVGWTFNGKMNYPMNIMLVFMSMENMMGGDMEKSLADLKAVVEKL